MSQEDRFKSARVSSTSRACRMRGNSRNAPKVTFKDHCRMAHTPEESTQAKHNRRLHRYIWMDSSAVYQGSNIAVNCVRFNSGHCGRSWNAHYGASHSSSLTRQRSLCQICGAELLYPYACPLCFSLLNRHSGDKWDVTDLMHRSQLEAEDLIRRRKQVVSQEIR